MAILLTQKQKKIAENQSFLKNMIPIRSEIQVRKRYDNTNNNDKPYKQPKTQLFYMHTFLARKTRWWW